MKNVKLAIILVSTAFLLCACLPKQQRINIKTYMFNTSALSQKTTQTGKSDKQKLPTIKIHSFSANDPFNSKFFIFKLKAGNYQQDYYHRFLVHPVVQLKQIMLDTLKSSGYFSQVFRENGIKKANYEADFTLRQLYVDTTNKQHVYAVISLSAEVTKLGYADQSELVFDQTYSERVPVTNYHAGAQQVILAWDKGLVTILNKLDQRWKKLKLVENTSAILS